jgi:acyl-CoA synthetase (NDP forming)
VRPLGIALVAAAEDSVNTTMQRARALSRWGYEGALAIVDKRWREYETDGPVAIPAVAELGSGFEVVLVATRAGGVVAALHDCAAGGVMNAVALAPGFEAAEGSRRRADLVEFLASVPEFRLIGPNCAGVVSAASGAFLSTSTALLDERVIVGGAALVLQSGGIGAGLLLALLRRGAGFAHWITSGDELDLGAIRIATALVQDPDCTAVGLFLEGITDPERLPELRAAIAGSGKPVVALKAGSSVGGRRAAFGHTGRLVGNGEIARAALEQAGVRLVDTLEELCDTTTVLSVMRPRARRGEARIAVVTAAGGIGVIAADEVAQTGNLRLAELTPEKCSAIQAAAGSPAPVANPYDVASVGDPPAFGQAVRAMAEHGGADVVVAVTTTLAHDHERLAAGEYAGLPPLVFAHLSPDERFKPEQARRLAAIGIPNVPSLRNAIRAVADWAGRDQPTVVAPIEAARSGARFGLIRSRDVLGAALDRWIAPVWVVRSAGDAIDAAARLRGAVAVKAEGSQIEHRSELGAVRTGLRSPDEIAAAYAAVAAVCAAQDEQVVVQAMAPAGIEVLVSVVRDPELGPVALCRAGGVLVELGGATTVLTGPRSSWPSLLERSLVGRLLAGYRGQPESDSMGLLDFVEAMEAAVRSDDRILGIECNPVLVHPLPRAPGTPAVTAVDLLAFADEPGRGQR